MTAAGRARTLGGVSDPPPPSLGGSLAVRLLLGAAVVFVALTVVGWIIGAVLSVLRALVVAAAVLAVIWLLVVGRRD